jgi:hypothetical protein
VLSVFRPVATIRTYFEPALGGVISRLYSYPFGSCRQASLPFGYVHVRS